ncbi:peroxiredoxin-like family protein [Tunicatimonas pelagia]|uniref:peroxiredoxin-like family protein n=1 Tax=Tunicatimonas pelagia TaxID=931531 RepID=UPI002665A398|nr:peroxiredoxin-like family protein [Tunicatimonas pelagia]WKN45158.1 peroxiredoxin-like family protein [Tunicatimonas pelagia]
MQQARQEGDTAVDFTLPNARGQSMSLKEYLQEGPVVLTWYRGGWCPYCNITLRALQQALPEFKAKGANLLALTPELPDKSLSTQEKNELEFEVLTDQANEVVRKYGLVFKLTPEVSELYKKNFSLAEYNGNDSDELPLAATYVIDKQGIIRYAFLDAEYRHRAEPQEIIEVLKSIQ